MAPGWVLPFLAGAFERANVPKEVPDYFVDQLFFPYVDGTAYVRAAVKRGGWEEVDRLDAQRVDAVVGMAVYTGQLPLDRYAK